MWSVWMLPHMGGRDGWKGTMCMGMCMCISVIMHLVFTTDSEFTMLTVLPLSQQCENKDLISTHRYFFLCYNNCTVLAPDCY